MVYFLYHNGEFDPPAFQYDPAKSRMNQAKHGIDFERAQALWLDARRIETEARWENEPRFVTVAMLEGTHWAAFFTLRGEAVRLISVRRARPEEVLLYEERDPER